MTNSEALGDGLLNAIYRYPVKGLTGEPLAEAGLVAGETLSGDRIYAIENGPGRFDALAPRHLPKINYVMLMRHEGLAALRSRFDTESGMLTLERDGRVVVRGCLRDDGGRQAIESFLAHDLEGRLQGQPRIVASTGHSFSDVKEKCLHVINLASVRALERHLETEIDPLRFRPNIVIDTGQAWQEFEWLQCELAIGEARLRVFKRTERCQAISVDPKSGRRDADLVARMKAALGHTDFGVYANVTKGGLIACGDRVGAREP